MCNLITLIFESTSDIADFIIKRKVSNAHVNSIEISLTSVLTSEDIEYAMKEYNAQHYSYMEKIT